MLFHNFKEKEKGIILIEFLLGFAIICILVVLLIRTYIHSKAILADEASLIMLNSATQLMKIKESSNQDIFQDIDSDQAKLDLLYEKKYLNEIPGTRQQGVIFNWNKQKQMWELTAGPHPD